MPLLVSPPNTNATHKTVLLKHRQIDVPGAVGVVTEADFGLVLPPMVQSSPSRIEFVPSVKEVGFNGGSDTGRVKSCSAREREGGGQWGTLRQIDLLFSG